MFLPATILQVLLLQSVLGEDYCSSNIIVKPECVPCSHLCPTEKRPCHTNYSFCPQQCGHTKPARECTVLCNKNCLGGRCEYKDDFIYLKCLGCKQEYTGQWCQEFCAPNCLECNQYNSTNCTKCKEKYRLPDCSEMDEITSPMHYALSTADIGISNCSSNCLSCNPTTGDCTECSQDNYGRRCENVCSHCNTSLCGNNIKCLDCISLSSSDCVTARTESMTTAESMANCTDAYCHPVPETKTHKGLKEDTLMLIFGISAAVVLLTGVICSWRKLNRRYKLKCVNMEPEERQAKSDNGSNGSLAANSGYVYIDDNDLDSYYSGLNKNRTRPPRCTDMDHYKSLDNQDTYQDVESGSSLSHSSETIFGNLFEVNSDLYDDSESIPEERQSQQERDQDYAVTYEMYTLSYLTPKLPEARLLIENL